MTKRPRTFLGSSHSPFPALGARTTLLAGVALTALTGSVARTARADGTWINPACSDTSLESPAGTCDGPWVYAWERSCSDPAICGYSLQCGQYASCATYDAGINKTTVTENPSSLYTYVERRTCKGPGWTQCTETVTGTAPGTKCGSVAASRRSAIVPTVPSSAPGYAAWLTSFKVNGSAVVVDATTTTQGGNSPNQPVTFTTTTEYKCKLTLVNRPSPMTGPAAACGCATYLPNTCRCETGTAYTSPAPDAPAPSSLGANMAFTSPPECTTCDDPSFVPSVADAADMIQCLENGLDDMPPDVRAARVARMKLVMQVAGDALDASDLLLVQTLYDQYDDAPVCQAPLAVDAACEALTMPDGTTIASQLQLCSDLAGAHVPSEAVAALLPHCIDVVAASAALPEGTCRDHLRDVAADVVGELIEHDAARYDASDGLDEELGVSLAQLDAWYEAVAPFSEPEWIRARSSDLAGRVWRRAHDAAMPLPPAASSDSHAAALLADVAETGLEVDAAMLRAAFDPQSPIDSPPLLYVVSDALRGTSERLEMVAPVHDTACRFAGCGPEETGLARSTPVTEALRAIASFDDGAALATSVSEANALAGQHPELVDTFAVVADNFDVLATAYERAGGGSLAALGDDDAAVPVEAQDLAAIVRRARTRVDGYDATGQLSPSHAHLSSAVLKQDQLTGFIDYGVGQINGAADAYESARLSTVNDLIEQTRTAGATRSVLDKTAAAVHETRELLGQLGGLRAREASEQASMGTFMAAFETVVESGAFDADAAYQVDVLPPVEIGPNDAHFGLDGAYDLPTLRAHLVTLEPGEILDVDMVDATWTPTCALSLSRIASPAGDPVGISAGGAVTGPEGYYLSWANTHYEAEGFQSSETFSESNLESFESCGGFSATFPPPITIPVGGVSVSVPFGWTESYRNCSTQTWGYGESHGTTSSAGDESRITASFNGGLRLPITPEPSAPVGSLLAVLTIHDQPNHVLDVRVVNRRDAIQAPAIDPALGTQVDVHFVVNDVTAPGCQPADDSLTLAMKIVTPAGVVARDVGRGMSESLRDIEAQKPAILAQGGLTPYDAQNLRTGAWARLTMSLAASGHGLQGLPLELKNLFEAQIEQAIASLGRRGEMQRVQRELDRLGLEVAALENELRSGATQSRLLGLVPRWRLRDLSGIELRPAMSALGEILTDYAAPIYDLRDPVRLSGFRAAAAGQLEQLVDVDFAAPLDEVANDLRAFAVSTRQNLVAAQFELPSTMRRTVVVAFPREPGACEGLCDEFRQASAEASARLWRGLEGGDHVGDVTLQAADLYSFSGGNARLSCQDLAPVVRRAAVYMLNPFNTSVDLGALGRELPATAGAGGARFAFPRSGGVVDFTADSEAGVQLALPVINGPGGDVLADFGTSSELGVGAGISPFSRFDVDFASFYTDAPVGFIDDTLAVLLVFEVERRVSTDPSFVPGVCQNAVF